MVPDFQNAIVYRHFQSTHASRLREHQNWYYSFVFQTDSFYSFIRLFRNTEKHISVNISHYSKQLTFIQ